MKARQGSSEARPPSIGALAKLASNLRNGCRQSIGVAERKTKRKGAPLRHSGWNGEGRGTRGARWLLQSSRTTNSPELMRCPVTLSGGAPELRRRLSHPATFLGITYRTLSA